MEIVRFRQDENAFTLLIIFYTTRFAALGKKGGSVGETIEINLEVPVKSS